MSALFLLAASGWSCTSGDAVDEVRAGDTIISDTPSDEFAWLGQASRVHFDALNGTLWVLDISNFGVTELTLSGELRSRFGLHGDIPGGVTAPVGFAVHELGVFILDLGRGRLVRFDRRSGEFLEEAPLPAPFRDVTVLDNGRLMLFPGHDAPFVEYDIARARFGRTWGDFEALGSRCVWCRLMPFDDHVLLLDGREPYLAIVHPERGVVWRTTFSEVEVLTEWKREEAESLGRSAARGGGKLFITDLAVDSENRAFLNVLPGTGSPRPNEIWVYDLPDREGDGTWVGGKLRRRIAYHEDWKAWYHTIASGLIVSVDGRTGAIKRYAIEGL